MTTKAHLKMMPPTGQPASRSASHSAGHSAITPPQTTQQLVKILIGAAWLDGQVQLEERAYLKRIAQEKGVAADREIYLLLNDLRAVSTEECYQWIDQYLGNQPSSEACQQLLEALSGLIYSDGTVATEEAKLLSRIQMIEQNCGAPCTSRSILSGVRKLYQHWAKVIESQ
jgi:uncharacterized tellurite resistance protein B-like protein